MARPHPLDLVVAKSMVSVTVFCVLDAFSSWPFKHHTESSSRPSSEIAANSVPTECLGSKEKILWVEEHGGAECGHGPEIGRSLSSQLSMCTI